jgi:hypothetical protein
VEWCDNLFYVSPRLYCEKLDPAYHASADEVLSFDHFVHLLDHALTATSLLQPKTTKPPAKSRSGKSIRYWAPRRVPYIGYKAPSISSVMQGPKTNLALDNPPLSALKRKVMTSKVLSHRTKKKIDTKDVNISDMAGVLAYAFEVLTFFSLSSSFCTFN